MLILLVSLSTFSTDLYIPAFPILTRVFHANASQLQWSLISYVYGFALCMLLSGILADYVGRKKTLLIGISLYTMASFLMPFISNIYYLIFLRFVQGLGGCCGTVIARVMVRDTFEKNKAIQMLALLSSGMAFAFIVAPVCGSLLIYMFNWKSCFIVMSVMGLFLLVGISGISEKRESIHIPIPIVHLLRNYKTAFSYKNFILHTLAISLAWTGFFLIVMEYPVIMMLHLKLSTVQFGFIFPLILFGYLFGTKTIQWLSARNISPNKMAFNGAIIMCTACFIGLIFNHLFENSIHVLIASGFLYLFGMGIQMPNSQYLAIPDEHKSSAVITSLLYLIEMLITALIAHFIKSIFGISINSVWISLFVLTQIIFLSFVLWKGGNKLCP